MKTPSRFLASLLIVANVWMPIPAIAEDIDIFTGGSIAASNPSILFVLDNTSNWARQSQQWPGGIQQGQSEANAIKSLIADSTIITAGINIGLMEFVTEGNANNTGGFVRYPIKPMDGANVTALTTKLDSIYNGVNAVTEKRNSNTQYGWQLSDVYNYLIGGTVHDTLNPPNPDAAADGYTTPYTTFKSPLTADNGCGRVFMVFIGNPNSSGPDDDSAANSTAITNLGCSATSIPLPNFTTASVAQQAALAAPNGTGVYASQADCEAAAATAYGAAYTSYSCSVASTSNVETTLATSSCGQYANAATCQAAATTAYGAAYPSYTCTDTGTTCGATAVAGPSACGTYADAGACITGVLASNPGFTSAACVDSGASCSGANLSQSYAGGLYTTAAACEAAAAVSWPGYTNYVCTGSNFASGDLDGATCYGTTPTSPSLSSAAAATAEATSCGTTVLAANTGKYTSVACGTAVGCAASSVATIGCGSNSAYSAQATCNTAGQAQRPGYAVYTCAGPSNAGVCGNGANKYLWTVTGSGNNSFQAIGTGKSWAVTATAVSTGTRFTMTGSGGSTYTIKGNTPATTYNVFGNYTATTSVPTGTYNATANKWNADEWARCLHQNDLSPDGTAAKAESFVANFNASGTITGADTITFDGATTTLVGGETPADIAVAVANTTYTNWIATSSSSGVVTFSRTSTGAFTDVVASDFTIVNAGGGAGEPHVSVDGFTANFNTSGVVVGADTITFDGITTTLNGGETASGIAIAVAAKTYPNWVATVSASGEVTFGRRSGTNPGVTAASFTIVDAGSTGTKPVVIVTPTTTQGSAATGGAVGLQNVTTYTIDVYNAQQNADHTGLLMSMAQQGGGRYFSARSEAQILAALKAIVSEIQSVNTAFAAASIPLSTTNRSQNLNEVYIGVFRPSLEPRWFGNLKKFSIKSIAGKLDLVDSNDISALNAATGFIADCSVSAWTTDSGAWWDQVKIGAATLADNTLINPVPRSSCNAMPAGNTSPWSDMPDGQSVEKGAVAEVIRRGNNPPTTTTTPTWQVNRTIYTRNGSTLEALSATNAGSTDLYNYVRGVDINVANSHVEEKTLTASTLPALGTTNAVRASVHGDVVHSRPLAVNYGTNNTVVYYGTNDGMMRAVDGLTGKEKWAFIPQEFLNNAAQTRLMKDTPLVAFGAAPAAGTTRKNYMFDGSPGLYQATGNTKVWLFPTLRRGGRMVHALNVTDNATPTLMWYKGCPNLSNDSSCAGDNDVGQTWSVPVVTKIKGYHATKPVVVYGGGYDDCEDTVPATNPPSWTTVCASAKGRNVFVRDAETGNLLKKFTITGMRGVTAGISFVDINNDGYADYGYVTDLGGTLYRLSFINNPTAKTALSKDDWSIKKVAYTSGARKFMFAPAVVYGGGVSVYAGIATGDRERPLASDYPYVSNVKNYVYGYRDVLDAYDAATVSCNLDRDTATAGTAADPDCVLDYTIAPAGCNSPGILPTNDPKRAWRVGMVYRGEQAVTQPVILGGLIAVNSTRPVPAGVCSANLGEGGGYFLNLINGSGAIGVSGSCGGEVRGTFQGVGLPTDPVVVNLPGQDPICVGCVSKDNTNPSVGSMLFKPTAIPPPISKIKRKKYRYTAID